MKFILILLFYSASSFAQGSGHSLVSTGTAIQTNTGGGDRDVLFRAAEKEFSDRMDQLTDWIKATGLNSLKLDGAEKNLILSSFLTVKQPKVVFSDTDLELVVDSDSGSKTEPKACLNHPDRYFIECNYNRFYGVEGLAKDLDAISQGQTLFMLTFHEDLGARKLNDKDYRISKQIKKYVIEKTHFALNAEPRSDDQWSIECYGNSVMDKSFFNEKNGSDWDTIDGNYTPPSSATQNRTVDEFKFYSFPDGRTFLTQHHYHKLKKGLTIRVGGNWRRYSPNTMTNSAGQFSLSKARLEYRVAMAEDHPVEIENSSASPPRNTPGEMIIRECPGYKWGYFAPEFKLNQGGYIPNFLNCKNPKETVAVCGWKKWSPLSIDQLFNTFEGGPSLVVTHGWLIEFR